MAISLLYGCVQVETSVRDIAASRDFMKAVLGAGEMEQQLAKEIYDLFAGDYYKVDHLSCGDALFQLNQASPDAELFRGQRSVHQSYIEDVGPCVTNLNYYIDDGPHAQELLTSLGAETRLEGPSTVARSLADYGDNTREGGPRSFYFMGTRELIGLDLEIMEPNFKRFCLQTAQYPAFVRPRPRVERGDCRLLRLRLVVDDLEQTYKNLVKIFAPASRSVPYDICHGTMAKAFRITLGGIELEYCQPLSGDGYLAQQREAYGPGVVTIDFGVRDSAAVVNAGMAYGAEAVQNDPSATCPVYRRFAPTVLQCREFVGFDVGLHAVSEAALAGESLPTG